MNCRGLSVFLPMGLNITCKNLPNRVFSKGLGLPVSESGLSVRKNDKDRHCQRGLNIDPSSKSVLVFYELLMLVEQRVRTDIVKGFIF